MQLECFALNSIWMCSIFTHIAYSPESASVCHCKYNVKRWAADYLQWGHFLFFIWILQKSLIRLLFFSTRCLILKSQQIYCRMLVGAAVCVEMSSSLSKSCVCSPVGRSPKRRRSPRSPRPWTPSAPVGSPLQRPWDSLLGTGEHERTSAQMSRVAHIFRSALSLDSHCPWPAVWCRMCSKLTGSKTIDLCIFLYTYNNSSKVRTIKMLYCTVRMHFN